MKSIGKIFKRMLKFFYLVFFKEFATHLNSPKNEIKDGNN